MKENYYKKFIRFLKEHNLYDAEALEYLRNNGVFFDFLEEENRDFIGCRYILDKNEKLQKIQICAPFIRDEKTILINIHEFTHGLMLYKYLGKKIKTGNDIEILPMLYERVYLIENYSVQVKEYIDSLNSQITEKSKIAYRIALEVQDEMLLYQKSESNPQKLNIKAKKLAKKYKLK